MELTAKSIGIGDSVRILVNSKFAKLEETGKVVDIKVWGTNLKYMIKGDLGCFWLDPSSIELISTKQTFYIEHDKS